MCNAQLNNKITSKFKIFIKCFSDSYDETNFPHKLLLTNTQVSRLFKAFTNGYSANTKLSKTQLNTIGQLLKTGLSLTKNILKPLAKSVLMPLRLTSAAIATYSTILKNIFWSGMTTLIIS